jgi:hypothetical protein
VLSDKNVASGGDGLKDLITAWVNTELKALAKSLFFVQSPIAHDVQAVLYQPFDDQHENLARFNRPIVRHHCGVHNSQTLDNPERASADSDDEEDHELDDRLADGNVSSRIAARLDMGIAGGKPKCKEIVFH